MEESPGPAQESSMRRIRQEFRNHKHQDINIYTSSGSPKKSNYLPITVVGFETPVVTKPYYNYNYWNSFTLPTTIVLAVPLTESLSRSSYDLKEILLWIKRRYSCECKAAEWIRGGYYSYFYFGHLGCQVSVALATIAFNLL